MQNMSKPKKYMDFFLDENVFNVRIFNFCNFLQYKNGSAACTFCTS
jgi:hypothetical protein